MWVQFLSQELEEGMATYSSSLAWRIPWTEEPGGLQSMGLQRIGHNRSDSMHRLHPQGLQFRQSGMGSRTLHM